MCSYLSNYQKFFRNKTKNNFGKAQQYVEGMVLSDLKNIERISETLEADYHKMQNFITESNRDARAVIDGIADNVSAMMSQQTLTGLLIDESGWEKKGLKAWELDINIVVMSEKLPIHKWLFLDVFVTKNMQL